jgi:hypothetical protein
MSDHQNKVDTIVGLGIPHTQAIEALQACGFDLNAAIER